METVEEYIPTEQEFASNILWYARSTYESMLTRKPDLHEELTTIGTELKAVEEVRMLKLSKIISVTLLGFGSNIGG